MASPKEVDFAIKALHSLLQGQWSVGEEDRQRGAQHAGVGGVETQRRAQALGRHTVVASVRDRRNRSGQVDGNRAALVQMAQEAAQDGADPLGCGTAESLRLARDEAARVLRGQALERDFPSAEARGEETADGGQVIRGRARTNPARVLLEALVGLCDPLARVVITQAGMWGRDPPGAAEQVQQLAAARRITGSVLLRFARGMECRDLIFVEILDSQLPRCAPPIHISSELQLLLDRQGCRAFSCEPSSECVDIVGKRTVTRPPLAFWIWGRRVLQT